MSHNLFFQLIDSYDHFHEKEITNRRFKYEQIVPFITRLQDDKRFQTEKVGESFLKRPIYKVTWGKGPIRIMMWSQMHGDEPTATKAILDVWNFLAADDAFNEVRDQLHDQLELHFIPVLNPDGMDLFQRRTVQGIDMNRDALRLQTPEGRVLKDTIRKINPRFGFNLHDQSPYYSAGPSSFPAVISFLAPAFNPAKEINEVRERAMQLIGLLNLDLQEMQPNHVGRYDDTFNVRAFGDNIQKWGISTILIESGAIHNDPHKEYIRKLNFALLIKAFQAIGNESYKETTLDSYESLPFNVKENFFDLIIRNAVIDMEGREYKVDIAVNLEEVPYNNRSEAYLKSMVADMGDLTHCNGYTELDAAGRIVEAGRVYPYEFESHEELKAADHSKILRNGYTDVMVSTASAMEEFTRCPLNFCTEETRNPILPGSPGDFIILEEKEVVQTVVNGFVVNYLEPDLGVGNGVVRSISE